MGPGSITVTVDVTCEGLVTLAAQDRRCRPPVPVTVSQYGALTEAEIAQILERADAQSGDDAASESWDALRQAAAGLIVSTENGLAQRATQLEHSDLADVTGAIAQLKQALESDDCAAVESFYAALQTTSQRLVESQHAPT